MPSVGFDSLCIDLFSNVGLHYTCYLARGLLGSEQISFLLVMKRAFDGLHVSCSCKKAKLEVFNKAAVMLQRIWKTWRTKILYWRYLDLSNVMGFTSANPDVGLFIERTALNSPYDQ